MENRERPPVWLWINLLSLDAPIVAVVWQDFLARSYSTILYPAGRWMLGLTVWAIYLTDRLLDARNPDVGMDAPRHFFYRRNLRLLGFMLGIALLSGLSIAAFWLRHAVFANGLIVGAAVIAYLGIFPVGGIEGPWKVPAAAVLFTTGVSLVAWTGTPRPEWKLGWPLVAFCALCMGNLILFRSWERGSNTMFTGVQISLFAVLCLWAGNSRWYEAVAISAASLATLAFWGGSLSKDARRVLADAVLLSPLLFSWR
jgi:hypothetical protein